MIQGRNMETSSLVFASDDDGNLGILVNKMTSIMRLCTKRAFNVSQFRKGDAMFMDISTMWSKVKGATIKPVDKSKFTVWAESETPYDYGEQETCGADERQNNACQPGMYKNQLGLVFASNDALCDEVFDNDEYCYIDEDDMEDATTVLSDGQKFFCACEDLLLFKKVPYQRVNAADLTYFIPTDARFTTHSSKGANGKRITGSTSAKKVMHHRTPLGSHSRCTNYESEGMTTVGTNSTASSSSGGDCNASTRATPYQPHQAPADVVDTTATAKQMSTSSKNMSQWSLGTSDSSGSV